MHEYSLFHRQNPMCTFFYINASFFLPGRCVVWNKIQTPAYAADLNDL